MYFCVTLGALNLAIKMIKLKFRFKSKAFMQKIQRGFTLIELVVVIVVLGILSAVAVPKYIDYKEGAGAAALKGVAAALAAAGDTNYAARLSGMTGTTAVTTCSDLSSLLVGAGVPDGYSVLTTTTSTAATASAAGTTGTTSTGAAVPGTFTPATPGVCTVKNSDFKTTVNFPYVAIL